MRASVEHRACHDVDESLGLESALESHSDDLSQHLQRGRGHHITEQFDEVCVTGIGTDHKCLLSETVEQRLTAFDVGKGTGGDNEKLARLGGIRISKHRRCDVALPATGMLPRQVRRGG
jgi:hypothetical protein